MKKSVFGTRTSRVVVIYSNYIIILKVHNKIINCKIFR